MKFIHLFSYCLFAFLFHSKISGETFIAIQDASIKENNSLTGNWSNVEAYGKPGAAIIALVEFDIGELKSTSEISSAVFRTYINYLKDNKSSTFSVYSTTNNIWDENSIQWSSRPNKNQLLDTITIDEIVPFHAIDSLREMR